MKNMRQLVLSVFLTAVALLAGCKTLTTRQASANFRYRVFETTADAIDRAVRKELTETVPNSAYSVSKVDSEQLGVLLADIADRPGLLTQRSRKISYWPKIADTWAYSKAYSEQDAYLTGAGTGAGFLGVRKKGRTYEVRVEYNVFHSIGTRNPIRSRIFYEGEHPGDRAIVFFAALERVDGSKIFHVIAFEIGITM